MLVNILVQNQVARLLFFDWPMAALAALMSSWVVPTAAACYEVLSFFGSDFYVFPSQKAFDTTNFSTVSAAEEMETMDPNLGVSAASAGGGSWSAEWLSTSLPAWLFFVWLLTAPLLALLQPPPQQDKMRKEHELQLSSPRKSPNHSKPTQGSVVTDENDCAYSAAAAEAKVDFEMSTLSDSKHSGRGSYSTASEVTAVAGPVKGDTKNASLEALAPPPTTTTARIETNASMLKRIQQHLHQLLPVSTSSLSYWLVWGTLVVLGLQGHLAFCSEARHPMSRFAHNLAVTWLLCEVNPMIYVFCLDHLFSCFCTKFVSFT